MSLCNVEQDVWIYLIIALSLIGTWVMCRGKLKRRPKVNKSFKPMDRTGLMRIPVYEPGNRNRPPSVDRDDDYDRIMKLTSTFLPEGVNPPLLKLMRILDKSQSGKKLVAFNKIEERNYYLYHIDFNHPWNEFHVKEDEVYRIAGLYLCDQDNPKNGILAGAKDGIIYGEHTVNFMRPSTLEDAVFYKRKDKDSDWYYIFKPMIFGINEKTGYMDVVLIKIPVKQPIHAISILSQQYLINRTLYLFGDKATFDHLLSEKKYDQ